MKKLFKAIKQNDFEEVKRIIESHYEEPELVNCISKAPPKMDAGQSALQVAIKNGGGWHDMRIISYLLDKGADVNYMEDDKGLNPNEIACWPVLMDMARAVYSNSTELYFKYHPEETKGKSDDAIAVFERMLDLGADPNKTDNRLRPVWTHVLNEYECAHTGNHAVCNEEYNIFLKDVTKRLMDMMVAHGADIYCRCISFPKNDPRYVRDYYYILRRQILINNLVFNRELSYGIAEITEKGHIPAGNRDYLDSMNLWIDFMRPYYEKDNPYYGAVVSEERKQFFRKLEQLRDEEEKDIF